MSKVKKYTLYVLKEVPDMYGTHHRVFRYKVDYSYDLSLYKKYAMKRYGNILAAVVNYYHLKIKNG